jgi:hypothetical protein
MNNKPVLTLVVSVRDVGSPHEPADFTLLQQPRTWQAVRQYASAVFDVDALCFGPHANLGGIHPLDWALRPLRDGRRALPPMRRGALT